MHRKCLFSYASFFRFLIRTTWSGVCRPLVWCDVISADERCRETRVTTSAQGPDCGRASRGGETVTSACWKSSRTIVGAKGFKVGEAGSANRRGGEQCLNTIACEHLLFLFPAYVTMIQFGLIAPTPWNFRFSDESIIMQPSRAYFKNLKAWSKILPKVPRFPEISDLSCCISAQHNQNLLDEAPNLKIKVWAYWVQAKKQQ